jgi:mannose/cellobiose epimerase-like protein (N-acyl-D-glucosamine 2-epimerase family)
MSLRRRNGFDSRRLAPYEDGSSAAGACGMAMDFRQRSFLLGHIRHTMSFYDPIALDPAGGFFQRFRNDGTIYDGSTRSLIASARFVFNYAMAYRQFGTPDYLARVRHGLDYLRRVHRDPATGGYAWQIVDGRPADTTNHCYGLAFVLLAYACAAKCGIAEARGWIDETFEVMERRFWLANDGLYANEADAGWTLSDYRGQNDNMHSCEALIACWEATGERKFLQRAALIAENITVRQAALAGGEVWEHYRHDWSLDLDFAKGENNANPLRPWGVQTGHQTEWAKLLLILDRHLPAEWHLRRAGELFDRAWARGWDGVHGGLVYGYDLDGNVSDPMKYFWVQAESLATAALLGARKGDDSYWTIYDRIWAYSWEYFVDHKYGAWYQRLTQDNRRIDDRKNLGNKTDYHTMGACYEVLNVVKE